MRRRVSLCIALTTAACHPAAPAPRPQLASPGSGVLFVWAGDADKRESDFLAVIGADPASPDYASVVATVPVRGAGTGPHHTEYEMPADGILWANGFDAGRTFRFDLRDPLHPGLLGSFGDAGPFDHPHSFARLASGHVLATFQQRRGDSGATTGALVELDAAGRVVRAAPAAVPAIDSAVRPYSLAVLPAIDRVVTTATDMHLRVRSRAVQVWRLSDLALLQTILLPPGPRGDENWLTAEPRVLADGRTVLVNTFTCGLYRLRGLESDSASAEWVYSSAWDGKSFCAVPVVIGRFWLQPSGPEHAVVSLDLSDPTHPREAGRLTLAPDEIPHWLGLEPGGTRLVITGYRALGMRVLAARVDSLSGAISLDSSFTTPGAPRPGVDLEREQWPHGQTGPAIPHGAVFSRP